MYNCHFSIITNKLMFPVFVLFTFLRCIKILVTLIFLLGKPYRAALYVSLIFKKMACNYTNGLTTNGLKRS